MTLMGVVHNAAGLYATRFFLVGGVDGGHSLLADISLGGHRSRTISRCHPVPEHLVPKVHVSNARSNLLWFCNGGGKLQRASCVRYCQDGRRESCSSNRGRAD